MNACCDRHAPRATWRATAFALLSVGGRPAMRSALAVGAAVGVPASVAFSPFGLRAEDLVHLMEQSRWVRALLWAMWMAVVIPATSKVLRTAGMATIRTLAPPRVPFLISVAALLSLSHLPWFLLHWRGSGLVSGLGALLLSLSLSCVFASGTPLAWRALLSLLPLGALFLPLSPSMRFAAGLLFAPMAIAAALRRATARPMRSWAWCLPSPVLLAICTFHALTLTRRHRGRTLLASMLLGFGGLMLRNVRDDPTGSPGRRSLAILTLPLAVASSLLVAPLLASERHIGRFIRVARLRRHSAVMAFLLMLGAPLSAWASTVSQAAALHSPGRPASLPLAVFAWGLVVSSAVGGWGRWHEKLARRSTSRFLLGVVIIGAILLAAVSW